jgi:hypothetical protein
LEKELVSAKVTESGSGEETESAPGAEMEALGLDAPPV